MIRLCYIKNGDVVGELKSIELQRESINGGPNYYVYSTANIYPDKINILYLSLATKERTYTKKNCRAITFKYPIKKKGFLKHIKTIIPLCRIIFEVFKWNPNHIICAAMPWSFVIYIVSKMINANLIVSVHTDLESKRLIVRMCMRFLLTKTDYIICHGPFLFNQVKRITKDGKNIVEYNCSCEDIIRFRGGHSRLFEKLRGRKVFTFVGRMEILKGVIDLYKAFLPLLRRQSHLLLCFVGSGSECAGIKRLAIEDGISDQVELFGKLEREQVAEVLRATWAAVMPTRKELSEGRCMAAMEALAMGVPVIVPDFGTFRYLVQHQKTGLLFEPDSIHSLRIQIEKILEPCIRKRLVDTIKKEKLFSSTNCSYSEAVQQCVVKINNYPK